MYKENTKDRKQITQIIRLSLLSFVLTLSILSINYSINLVAKKALITVSASETSSSTELIGSSLVGDEVAQVFTIRYWFSIWLSALFFVGRLHARINASATNNMIGSLLSECILPPLI